MIGRIINAIDKLNKLITSSVLNKDEKLIINNALRGIVSRNHAKAAAKYTPCKHSGCKETVHPKKKSGLCYYHDPLLCDVCSKIFILEGLERHSYLRLGGTKSTRKGFKGLLRGICPVCWPTRWKELRE